MRNVTFFGNWFVFGPCPFTLVQGTTRWVGLGVCIRRPAFRAHAAGRRTFFPGTARSRISTSETATVRLRVLVCNALLADNMIQIKSNPNKF